METKNDAASSFCIEPTEYAGVELETEASFYVEKKRRVILIRLNRPSRLVSRTKYEIKYRRKRRVRKEHSIRTGNAGYQIRKQRVNYNGETRARRLIRNY